MFQLRSTLFGLNRDAENFMDELPGTPIPNDKVVTLASTPEYPGSKNTSFQVAIPHQVDLDFFKNQLYGVVEAKFSSKDNIAWTGNGKVGISDYPIAAGSLKFTAEQVYTGIWFSFYGTRESAPNFDEYIENKDYDSLIKAIMNFKSPDNRYFGPNYADVEVYKASNVNGEFNGIVSSQDHRMRYGRYQNGQNYYFNYSPFLNGSFSVTDGGFDGSLRLNLKDIQFHNISEVTASKMDGYSFENYISFDYSVLFKAEEATYDGTFNASQLSFTGNTVGKAAFAGMGGLLNVSIESYHGYYDHNTGFPYEYLLIIPLVLFVAFISFYVFKNRKKYFKYQAVPSDEE
ncbi:hypothetical protein HK103_002042 [Boothiomyces macroporosus]|uniref:Uncharacterized protein n=1 Tax=Boothiomyces macroporosus TaxID=261099 RepID=A0AAD5UA20_9FUNG|nr:hypothetical protein HK103_002042 [Boothiomyces macroporosus]